MSVKRLCEGRYLVSFTDSEGKRHRIKVRGNERTAKLKEAHLLEQREMEIMYPERRKKTVSFRQLTDNYFRLHGPQLRARRTWEYMANQILKKFGNHTMQQLTSKELQVFYNELRASGLTVATVRRNMTLINAIINLAIKHGDYVGINPCKSVDMEPEDNKRTRYLSQEEIQLLKDNCRADVWPVVFCALCTGMRRGEILNLAWENVDLIHNNITLLKTKSAKKREIPILPELKEMLLRVSPKPSGKVFEISKDAFNCSWKRMLAKLQIPDVCFHTLRHTFSSYFMMNGGVITDLQQILGHSTLALTQRYAHLSPEHIKKGMQVMQGVFSSFNEAKENH